jgi:CDGSH-type Zn-finger protein
MRFMHAADMDRPKLMTLEAGTYHWCQCGQTRKPPFCDGSHVGSSMAPLKFEADGRTTMAICTCGLSKNPPYCDGSHHNY